MTEVVIKDGTEEQKVKHMIGNFYSYIDEHGCSHLFVLSQVEPKACALINLTEQANRLFDAISVKDQYNISQEELRWMLGDNPSHLKLINKVHISIE